jgi:hypothetical protein
MRLTLMEKKAVKMMTEHTLELNKQGRVQGKRKEDKKELNKLLTSILKKVTKDIEEEGNKNE